ncbi:MAG: VOC family protein [Candidatus Dormibacteraceae bacterium]
MSAIRGFHHVTACVEGAQQDIDFYTGILGARLIKQTVLLDGAHGVYHLYYADQDASLGDVLTSFPYAQRGVRGRRGSGQIDTLALSVPPGALEFWAERLDRHNVQRGALGERFGRRVLSFDHPAGLGFELVEDATDQRTPWTHAGIPEAAAIRGLRSVTLSLRELGDTATFLVELGFRNSGSKGAFTRFEINGGGATRTVDVVEEPDRAPGTWTYAAGTVHHVAFAVESEEPLLEIKARLEGLGYVDVSDVKDRNYFHSIYVRIPGGVLFEFATAGPGFAIDEPADRLGRELQMPAAFAGRREQLLADLEPIELPAH